MVFDAGCRVQASTAWVAQSTNPAYRQKRPGHRSHEIRRFCALLAPICDDFERYLGALGHAGSWPFRPPRCGQTQDSPAFYPIRPYFRENCGHGGLQDTSWTTFRTTDARSKTLKWHRLLTRAMCWRSPRALWLSALADRPSIGYRAARSRGGRMPLRQFSRRDQS